MFNLWPMRTSILAASAVVVTMLACTAPQDPAFDVLITGGRDGPSADWTTFTQYFARLEQQGISINTIAHVASEQVRRVVMGFESRPSTADERKRMTDLVARSMEE